MSSWLKKFFVIAVSLSILMLAYIAWSGYQFFRENEVEITELVENDEGFRFTVLSDNEGDTAIFQNLLGELRNENAEFLIHLGDLSPRGAAEDLSAVRESLASLPYPYYTAIGNNDLGRDRSRTLYTTYYGDARPANASGGATYYSFDYENAHFVVLDNADRRVGFDEEQLTWLRNDLAENTQQWTFLFMHRPVDLPLSSITGDDETPASRLSNAEFLKTISQHPITRIFAGHIHTLFTYTLQDIPVSVSGGGGAQPQDLIRDFVGPVYHYLHVRVTEDSVDVEVRRLEK